MDIRLDELTENLKIYQDPEGFRFGTDSVLLSWFTSRKTMNKLCDLCAGNGAVGLIVSERRPKAEITLLEILPKQADLAKKSVKYNGLENRISVVCGDLKNCETLLKRSSFDAVTVNPPYSKKDSGMYACGEKSSARAELSCDFSDVAKAASYLLKFGRELFCIIKAERLADAICSLRENGLEPKRLLTVQSLAKNPPYAVLIEAKKGGSPGLIAEKPLVLNNDDGTPTEDLKKIYSFRRKNDE